MNSRTGYLAFALILALALLAGACSDNGNPMSDHQGGVQFVLSSEADGSVLAGEDGGDDDDDRNPGDDNLPPLQSASVTLSSVLARNLDGELIDVALSLPVTVDLIGLLDGGTFDLGAGLLPEGTYDQIVVVMTHFDLVTQDGTTVEITPPGGGWTAIVRVCPFTVTEDETTTVNLVFRRRGWLRVIGVGDYRFEPEFFCAQD